MRRLLLSRGVRDSTAVNLLYLLYSAAKKLAYWRLDLLRPESLARIKTCDTLVVLGAGESINSMSPAQWDEVSRYDVAGFSYSCLLPIRHTVYFFESPLHPASIEQHLKLMPVIRMAEASGRLERVIWKNPETRLAERLCDLENVERMGSVNLLSGRSSVVKAVTGVTLRYRMFRQILLQYRGSAFAVAWLAGLLGYRRVIFCGVDLRGPRYFFETRDEYAGYGLVNPMLLQRADTPLPSTHPTNDSSSGIPITQALEALCKSMSGTRYYVANGESALSEFLPTWSWGTTDLHADGFAAGPGETTRMVGH